MDNLFTRFVLYTSVGWAVCCPLVAAAVESPWRPADRIAVSMDGNGGSARTNHKYTVADPDDIGASAVALAIMAKAGVQDQLVHFDFNNWMDVGPVPAGKDRMTPSVMPAIDKWGFNPEVFFDLTKQPEEGIANLTEAINASTADSHLFIVAAGPIESIYRAVDNAEPAKRKHVSIVSHSNYNEMHLIQDDHRTIEDFKPFMENDGLGYIKIKDQNAQEKPHVLWHAGKNFEVWSFLRDSGDPDYRWLFERIKAHTYNKSDVSDAGMVFFLLKNDEDGSPAKLKALLGESMSGKAVAAAKPVTLTAKDDFTERHIEGFPPVYFDQGRNAIAVNAVKHKDVFAAAEGGFPGAAGRYDITVTSLTELDGESSYRVSIDGKPIGEFQNPTTDTDYAPHQHTFPGVEVKRGATIRVASSSVSNDKIPEGDGFAYSRGRWRELTFTPSAKAAAVSGTIVALEAEDMEIVSGWELKDDELASGGKYLAYTAYNSFQKVTPHRLKGAIEIEVPGRYTVKWSMRQPDDVPGDQANDIWLNFPDATQFGHGEISGFNKFLGRSKGTFGLNGTVEVQHKQAWLTVEFPKPSRYTVEIAGRSQGLQLDRLVLFRGMKFEQVEAQLAATP